MKKYTILLISIGFFVQGLKAQEPYYNDVNLSLTGQDLYFELQNKISQASSTFTYGDAKNAAFITDEDPENTNNVLLVFGYNDQDGNCTTDRSRDKDLFGGNSCEWNREHVFARSNANPPMGNVDNSTTGIGADPHNIRPSDSQMNNNKGNRIFTDGSGNAGVVGGNWYPGDEWKGDVARMMMYLYTRYGNQCLPSLMGTGPLQGSTDMLQLYLEWNVEDPVSEFEDQRNPHLENVYGNRNPFIDNPYLATIIWGGPIAEDRWHLFSVSEATANSQILLFPNPANTSFAVSSPYEIDSMGITIYTLTGEEIVSYPKSKMNESIDVSNLPTGIYLVVISTDREKFEKKLIIQ
ncbi:MAG TPA: endonuclease [Flavobacteriaceae bacterium]|nr:endonuclease [Flavobacteriaceae bacterium]MCB9213772.1 endonuclease [Alteromonas sp.]HPF11311.1 endonuclease [Flavobacteriaceae bacterium]HQU22197.1 endonuclease [Flavobacteriaceae bacterium]HQU64470.1 endonuclease [Flavobacteriaceae bacterium]